jgi:hypothetical protein
MTRQDQRGDDRGSSGSSRAKKQTRALDLPQADYDERATMHAWERVLSGDGKARARACPSGP